MPCHAQEGLVGTSAPGTVKVWIDSMRCAREDRMAGLCRQLASYPGLDPILSYPTRLPPSCHFALVEGGVSQGDWAGSLRR